MRRYRGWVVPFMGIAAACSSSSSGPVDDGAGDASVSDGGSSNDGSSGSDASSPMDGGTPAPPVAEALQGLALFDGWEDARALAAPVNTDGWEDSSYISSSGTRLYFGYTRYDYWDLSQGIGLNLTGPVRPGGMRDGFEIYEATIEDGGWSVARSSANSSDTTISEAAEGVTDDESTMVFIRFGASNADDVYLTKKSGGTWGAATALPSPINTTCIEDNAAISRDGTVVYFDSNRVDDLGTSCKATTDISSRTIYKTTFDGTNWSNPVKLGGAPNGGLFHWQVYPREDPIMYWAGHDGTCAADACIMHAQLEADGGYGDPVVVAQPKPSADAGVGDVMAIGEVSITRDGHWMYFTYMQKTTRADGGPNANLNIGVAHKP